MVVQYLQTSSNPNHTIISLHGWTGNVKSMQQVAKAFNFIDTYWIFPQAPYSASPGGFSWFEGDKKKGWDYNPSIRIIDKLVNEQLKNGFTHNNIFLLGFSQGASLVLEYMVGKRLLIAGGISIAGFIRDKKRFNDPNLDTCKNGRLLLIHGKNDQIIFPSESKKAYKIFTKLGYQVDLKILNSRHKVPMDAKPLIEKFLSPDLILKQT